MKNVLIAALALLALVFIAAPYSSAFFGFGSKYVEVKSQDGAVKIPVKDVSDGDAHFYTYRSVGKDINFFVVKSKDSVVRAAFDACDVCFHAKKGYTQEGDTMICNNCGMRFHNTRINEVKGGCNPSPLARTLEGDVLTIKTEDILGGGKYF